MVARPTAAELESSELKSAKKPRFGQLANFVGQLPGGDPDTELTIAAGVVTPTRYLHRIDTEGETAADNLDQLALANLPDGSLVKLTPENAARVVTARHLNGTGNPGTNGEMVLTNGEDFAFDDAGRWMILRRKGTQWIEVLRSTVFGRRVGGAADAAALRSLGDTAQAIMSQTVNNAPQVGDYMPYNRGGADRRMLLEHYLKIIAGLTEDAAPDLANDWLVTYDTSAAVAKKVKPSKIGDQAPTKTLVTKNLVTLGAQAQLDFGGFIDTTLYWDYTLEFWLRPTTDGAFPVLLYSTDGLNFSTANYSGTYKPFHQGEGAEVGLSNDGRLLPGGSNTLQVGNDANDFVHTSVRLGNLGLAATARIISDIVRFIGSEVSGSANAGLVSRSWTGSTDPVSALRVKFNTGNVAAVGWATLIGHRKQ